MKNVQASVNSASEKSRTQINRAEVSQSRYMRRKKESQRNTGTQKSDCAKLVGMK